ncbi:hypothetical protein [Fluviicola sp.]|uniref:hypothetical protein n=1 Tax=Fluviicola sp. TaxID=1917219 RepID=UPI00260AD408|nr:hypothetical protein [Fluviicola sp.]
MILIAPDRQKRRDLKQQIENNAQTCITYKDGGESTYLLLVILESGDTIQSLEHYAEGGYAFTETVVKSQIITSQSKY